MLIVLSSPCASIGVLREERVKIKTPRTYPGARGI
jgi:hypothetical protein